MTAPRTVNDLIKELQQFDGNTPIAIASYLDQRSRYAYGYSSLHDKLFSLNEQLITPDLKTIDVVTLDFELTHLDFDHDLSQHTAKEDFEIYNRDVEDDDSKLDYLAPYVAKPDFTPTRYAITLSDGTIYYGKTTEQSKSIETKAGFIFASIRVNGKMVSGMAVTSDRAIGNDKVYDII